MICQSLRIDGKYYTVSIPQIKDSGKKHRQIKLQRLEKVRIWSFGLSVH